MKHYDYTRRLFIYFALLFLAYAVIGIRVQRTTERHDKTTMITRRAEIDADGIAGYYAAHGGKALDSARTLFPAYLRITVIAADGHILYESRPGAVPSENHLERPEVKQAILLGKGNSTRYSRTIGKDLFYFAKAYPGGNIVRIAIPYAIEYKSLIASDNFFLYFMLITLVPGLLLIVLITGRFQKAVKALRRFISSANEHKGTPTTEDITFPKGELGDIGREIQKTFHLLEHNREKVRVEREKMLQHFSLSDEGIAFFTRKREFIYANSPFMQLVNAVTDEPTFSPDERLLKTKEFRAIDRFLSSDRGGEMRMRYVLERAGGQYAVLVQIFPDNSFEIRLSNISAHEESRRLKYEMTSNIAHELRTPVSCVRGYIETLRNAPAPLTTEKQHFFLDRAYDQLLRLSTLISDISRLNKLEEAAYLYPKEEVLFDVIVAKAAVDLEEMLTSADFSFTTHLDKPLPLSGNATLLNGIVRNLIENSIRYAGNGHTAEIFLSAEDRDYYYFSFSDNGPGVPEETLPRLFDRFYRTDEGRARTEGGSGLGLAIVKNTILFHGGTVQAKTRKGGGLEIVFSLRKQAGYGNRP